MAGRCFEVDRKSVAEPLLSRWISLVSLAGCAAGCFKTADVDRLHDGFDGQ